MIYILYVIYYINIYLKCFENLTVAVTETLQKPSASAETLQNCLGFPHTLAIQSVF